MDPELQGNQNEEYKPPSGINANPTRDEAPETRDNTGKDLTDPNLADEEGVPAEEGGSQNNPRGNQGSNQRGGQQQQHLTQSGQPDMRFAENEDQIFGQS